MVLRNRVNGKSSCPKQVKNDDVAVCECEPPASSSGAAGCHVDSCLNALLCTECTPGFCPCGDACRNQRFQRCEHARTVVKKVKGRGWGLVAAEPIKAGQFVIEYCGEVVPNKEAQRRHAAYLAAGEKNVYLLKLNAREVIDPTKMGAAARFVNHSWYVLSFCFAFEAPQSDPNCETRKWTVLGEIRVGIFARKDIEPGCELTYDYDYEWYGGDKVKCRCGAAACVGFLGAKSRAFQEDTYLWVDDDGRSEDSEYNDDEEEEEGEEEEGEEEEGEEEVRVGGRETREGAEEAGKEGKAEGKGERQAELVERKGVGRRVGKGGSKDVSGAGEGDVKVGGEQEEQEAEEEEKEVWVSRGEGEGYGAEEWQEWMENDSEGWEEEGQEEEGGSVADLTQDGDEEEVGEGAGMSDGGGYEGQEGEGAERMQEGEEGGEGGEGGGIKARGLKRKARKPRVKRPGIPKACSFSGKRPIMPLGPGQAR
ncbi:unnamed protein product [Closterium sp. NIES-65]|nr:unnamed protein product [Closterium sp. NIES-65]